MVINLVNAALDKHLKTCKTCNYPGRIGKSLYIDDCCVNSVIDIIKRYGGVGYTIVECFNSNGMLTRSRIRL